ncbi:oligosaccharide flippase family protein [Leeuwenhoekiella polynyae]|uniref:PST family polysaccharide transporter n=1 Tax=Leeuwenhoekiella polynyae TaxID=1550906 RepID=A0A4Q0NTZ2_9FLAO|nr:oligosaccharide flippase family protein [Leeuwenhoekiella polynyae]RXG14690.1 PST family polysaccharide transporter [Leeuwenhoekiella polynyae]
MFKKTFNKLSFHKKLIHNFGYLSVLQVFNMVLPLVTYPYLIRALGIDTYGLVVFAQTTISYLVIIVSFGFNISATKEVSIYRNDHKKLSEIVSSTFIIKFFLLLCSFIILLLLFYVIPQASDYKLLFTLTMWLCVYEFLFPIWYFQGIEQMKYITYLTLFSRLIFLGLIFLFIHNEDDYLYVPLINGLGSIIAGLVSLYIVFNKHKITFSIVNFKILRYHFLDSCPIFVSRISSFKDNTPAFLLGVFVGNQAVAYYDLAYKVFRILISVFDNITNVVFPLIAQKKNFNFLKKILRLEILVLFFSYLILILLRKPIVLLLGGQDLLPAADLFFVIGVLLLRPFSSIVGSCVLILKGYNKSFMMNLIYSTLFYFCFTLICWRFFSITLYNVAWGIVLAQLFELFHRFYLIKRKNLMYLIR